MRVVDCHTHAVPDGYLAVLEADVDAFGVHVQRTDGRPTGFEIDRPGGYFRREAVRLHDAHRSLDTRRLHMAEVGVDVQVLSAPTYVFGYDLGRDAAVRNARAYNDALASLVDGHEDFLGLGVVPLQHAGDAADELERLLRLPGLIGAIVGTRVAGRELDDPELEPFWAAAAALGAVVLVHPSTVSAPERYEAHYLTHSLGLPGDTALALARLVLGGVLARHRQLRIVAAHGGGSFAFLLPRVLHIARAVAGGSGAIDPEEVAASADRLRFDTVVHGAALPFLLEAVGAERLLLGSDYPAATGIAHPVDAVRALPGLEAAELTAVAGSNLERLAGR